MDNDKMIRLIIPAARVTMIFSGTLSQRRQQTIDADIARARIAKLTDGKKAAVAVRNSE
ncbi:MAG: hypothetical protein IKG61_10595 [Selenomonadaceae bacterium]|nr:hypothetical protein [Selenomonadaceae bacterium]